MSNESLYTLEQSTTKKKMTEGDKWPFNPEGAINPEAADKLKLKKEIYPDGFDIDKL